MGRMSYQHEDDELGGELHAEGEVDVGGGDEQTIHPRLRERVTTRRRSGWDCGEAVVGLWWGYGGAMVG